VCYYTKTEHQLLYRRTHCTHASLATVSLRNNYCTKHSCCTSDWSLSTPSSNTEHEQFHSWTSALDGDDSSPRPGRFTPDTQWIRWWVCPRTVSMSCKRYTTTHALGFTRQFPTEILYSLLDATTVTRMSTCHFTVSIHSLRHTGKFTLRRGTTYRQWRKLHNEELYALYSPNIIPVKKAEMRRTCRTYGGE
jgi:hypothetical protein